MNMRKYVASGMVLTAALFLFVASGFCDDEKVRAKIAIQILTGEDSVWARANDKITSQDKLRVFVIPKSDQHVYVVYSNANLAQLLLHEKVPKETILKLPDGDHYFQVDGTRPQESFWVVCSPEPLKELEEQFADHQTSHENWEKVAAGLFEKGGMDIAQKMKKPISMAGTVRSLDMSDDELKEDLLTFSGRSVLIKRFVFDVSE